MLMLLMAMMRTLMLLLMEILMLMVMGMCAGAGIMYPVFAAAMVDHSTEDTKDMAIATFRFWRDLGYVMGAGAGVLADMVTAELAMIVFAALVFATGLGVVVFYEERLRGAARPPRVTAAPAPVSAATVLAANK